MRKEIRSIEKKSAKRIIKDGSTVLEGEWLFIVLLLVCPGCWTTRAVFYI
jgi:hypothetical protein